MPKHHRASRSAQKKQMRLRRLSSVDECPSTTINVNTSGVRQPKKTKVIQFPVEVVQNLPVYGPMPWPWPIYGLHSPRLLTNYPHNVGTTEVAPSSYVAHNMDVDSKKVKNDTNHTDRSVIKATKNEDGATLLEYGPRTLMETLLPFYKPDLHYRLLTYPVIKYLEFPMPVYGPKPCPTNWKSKYLEASCSSTPYVYGPKTCPSNWKSIFPEASSSSKLSIYGPEPCPTNCKSKSKMLEDSSSLVYGPQPCPKNWKSTLNIYKALKYGPKPCPTTWKPTNKSNKYTNTTVTIVSARPSPKKYTSKSKLVASSIPTPQPMPRPHPFTTTTCPSNVYPEYSPHTSINTTSSNTSPNFTNSSTFIPFSSSNSNGGEASPSSTSFNSSTFTFKSTSAIVAHMESMEKMYFSACASLGSFHLSANAFLRENKRNPQLAHKISQSANSQIASCIYWINAMHSSLYPPPSDFSLFNHGLCNTNPSPTQFNANISYPTPCIFGHCNPFSFNSSPSPNPFSFNTNHRPNPFSFNSNPFSFNPSPHPFSFNSNPFSFNPSPNPFSFNSNPFSFNPTPNAFSFNSNPFSFNPRPNPFSFKSNPCSFNPSPNPFTLKSNPFSFNSNPSPYLFRFNPNSFTLFNQQQGFLLPNLLATSPTLFPHYIHNMSNTSSTIHNQNPNHPPTFHTGYSSNTNQLKSLIHAIQRMNPNAASSYMLNSFGHHHGHHHDHHHHHRDHEIESSLHHHKQCINSRLNNRPNTTTSKTYTNPTLKLNLDLLPKPKDQCNHLDLLLPHHSDNGVATSTSLSSSCKATLGSICTKSLQEYTIESSISEVPKCELKFIDASKCKQRVNIVIKSNNVEDDRLHKLEDLENQLLFLFDDDDHHHHGSISKNTGKASSSPFNVATTLMSTKRKRGGCRRNRGRHGHGNAHKGHHDESPTFEVSEFGIKFIDASQGKQRVNLVVKPNNVEDDQLHKLENLENQLLFLVHDDHHHGSTSKNTKKASGSISNGATTLIGTKRKGGGHRRNRGRHGHGNAVKAHHEQPIGSTSQPKDRCPKVVAYHYEKVLNELLSLSSFMADHKLSLKDSLLNQNSGRHGHNIAKLNLVDIFGVEFKS